MNSENMGVASLFLTVCWNKGPISPGKETSSRSRLIHNRVMNRKDDAQLL